MILLNPIPAMLCFITIGIDIAIFFLIVRLILTWRNFRWLVPFDKTGSSLVEAITQAAGKVFSSRWSKKLSEKGKILTCFVGLMIIKLIISALLNCSV